MTTAPIALTMGDPAGIGPEIVARLCAEKDLPRLIVIGDAAMMRRAIGITGVPLATHAIDTIARARFAPGSIDILQVGSLPADLPFGKVDARAGAAAYANVERAIREARSGTISAIVTAPLNKEAMKAGGKH